MKLNKLKKRYKKIPIASKITILYSSIFTISLLAISILMMSNVNYITQKNMKTQIYKTINNIEEYIKSGEKLDDDKIKELLAEKYIEVQVNNYNTLEIVKSTFGNVPPFIQAGIPVDKRMDFKVKAEDVSGKSSTSNDSSSISKDPPMVTPNVNKDRNRFIEDLESKVGEDISSFIISDSGTEFMLCEKVIKYNDEIYMIQAYKYLDNASMIKLAQNIILIGVIGIFLAVLIARYISRLMLKPVRSMTDIAERISFEDLSQRIEIPTADDEFKELAITFNSMIERLEKSFIQQKTFISDASHELRTPISVIQGYAKLVNRWGKSDPQILQESIDSIIAETDHMSTLIKKLLYLAKGEENKSNVNLTKVSLNQLAEETAKELEVIECKRNVELDIKDEVSILGDSDLIKQLLWIHCENAIKYTKENGNIKISVFKDDVYGCICVEDDGTGIERESLPLIFDRFYRVDKARNKEIPGTGLGLSIAKWIIDCHKGKIDVESEKDKGSKFINKFKLYKE